MNEVKLNTRGNSMASGKRSIRIFYEEMIEIANQCYDQGHQVVVYTARGMTIFTGDVKKIYSNMYELTKGQLDEWGVKYHQLIMGKAHYDILIDDKAINSEEIKSVDDIEDFLG